MTATPSLRFPRLDWFVAVHWGGRKAFFCGAEGQPCAMAVRRTCTLYSYSFSRLSWCFPELIVITPIGIPQVPRVCQAWWKKTTRFPLCPLPSFLCHLMSLNLLRNIWGPGAVSDMGGIARRTQQGGSQQWGRLRVSVCVRVWGWGWEGARVLYHNQLRNLKNTHTWPLPPETLVCLWWHIILTHLAKS